MKIYITRLDSFGKICHFEFEEKSDKFNILVPQHIRVCVGF